MSSQAVAAEAEEEAAEPEGRRFNRKLCARQLRNAFIREEARPIVPGASPETSNVHTPAGTG